MLHITHNPLLSARTTLGLGGAAIAEITLHEAVDCYHVPEQLKILGGQPFVLGGGSNILAEDGILPYVLMRGKFTNPPYLQESDEQQAFVRVGGGVRLPVLLARCAAWGLHGLEGLCGIPGTVGGAVAMNAGSFGSVIGPLLHTLRIYTPTLGIVDVDADQLCFSYRHMAIKEIFEWFLVVQATFRLTYASRNGINKTMRLNFFKKKSTQPLQARSAGCVFKNPSAEQPAGMLLEQAGYKGKRLGSMAFSELHANFLINEGGGSTLAALELMEQARDAVYARFGVCLVPEVRVVACQSS